MKMDQRLYLMPRSPSIQCHIESSNHPHACLSCKERGKLCRQILYITWIGRKILFVYVKNSYKGIRHKVLGKTSIVIVYELLNVGGFMILLGKIYISLKHKGYFGYKSLCF